MKRDKNLIELSKDHHHGLLLCFKIKQGVKYGVNPLRIAEYVKYFWTEALFSHFKEEEEVILPVLEQDDALRLQTLSEHREIEQLISALSDSVSEAELLKIAKLVDEHIRFEERVLFPHMEEVLSSSVLDEVGAAIEARHQIFLESYPDAFWEKPKK